MMRIATRFVCFVLILSTICSVPVFAEESVAPYASSFFNATETYLYVIDGNRFGVWFGVLAKRSMDELGVRSIVMQKSNDGISWRDIKTFYPESYPQMISLNDSYHADGVPYTGTYNYYYRAYVEFYAKDGNSTGIYTTYTATLFLSV